MAVDVEISVARCHLHGRSEHLHLISCEIGVINVSFFKKSPWLIHYDGSSCNGCDIEVLACLTPVYDIERFGIINTGNPKHADILLITGSVNEQNKEVIQNIYSQMQSLELSRKMLQT